MSEELELIKEKRKELQNYFSEILRIIGPIVSGYHQYSDEELKNKVLPLLVESKKDFKN